MSAGYVTERSLRTFDPWTAAGHKRTLSGIHIELTARCDNNCRHCYINLPASDAAARASELTTEEISELGDQATRLGALWCILGGGEPLLRRDFADIYLALKRKGLLLSVFTNADLVTEDHVRLFRRYPPRLVEITIYGVSRQTHERVTRTPGSFDACLRGLDRLTAGGIPFRLKAMVLKSNVHELDEIRRFCRARTKDYFRFDPFLHLRIDGDQRRNREIEAERLTPAEVVAVEMSDPRRVDAMLKKFERVVRDEFEPLDSSQVFRCGVGQESLDVSWNGIVRACLLLWHPDCVYDWRKGSLPDAWQRFFPAALDRSTARPEFLAKCRACRVINLCMWCPANAYLEVGELDRPVDFYCELAHARAEALRKVARDRESTGDSGDTAQPCRHE